MAKCQDSKETIISQHIGKKIRKRRIELEMTQTDLGNHLPTSFQQIQKYEKGTNAVSSPKLLYLSLALKVPVSYFFEGFDIVKGEKIRIQGYLEDFALSKEEADNLIMSARNIIYKD